MPSPVDDFDHDARSDGGCSPAPQLPKAPQPSSDAGIVLPSQAPEESNSIPDDSDHIDIFALTPAAALKLLTAEVESLVHTGNEIPPTPPVSSPTTPRLPERHPEHNSHGRAGVPTPSPTDEPNASPNSHHHEDIPGAHKTPIGSPELHPTDPSETTRPAPGIDTGALSQEKVGDDQRAILARKFYSKVAPPIPLAEYLQRLHKYCPMSTAVYLAAGFYLLRLSSGKDCLGPSSNYISQTKSFGSHSSSSDDEEDDEPFVLPITGRTAHRLLLASLRIATKALEDRNFPHARFAKVGGVSEKELSRLEVNFAFLVQFRLVVDQTTLEEVAKIMRRAAMEEEVLGDELADSDSD